MAVEIQKTLCGGINTDNLIKFTCFYLQIVESMCFNFFSRARMFCNDDSSN